MTSAKNLLRLRGRQELCHLCANVEGCPLRELLTSPVKECEEFTHVADILGPVVPLSELEGPC